MLFPSMVLFEQIFYQNKKTYLKNSKTFLFCTLRSQGMLHIRIDLNLTTQRHSQIYSVFK